MEISSRQIVALLAPLVVTYLTWSVVSGTPPRVGQPDSSASVATAAAAKRPVVEKLTRDLFTRDGSFGEGMSGVAGPGDPGGKAAVRLNGTVVAGKWRMAIIDGTRVFEGQTFRGYDVRTVTRDGVTLVGSDGQAVTLSLDIAQPPPLATLAKTKPIAVSEKAATKDAEDKRPQGPAGKETNEPKAGAASGASSSARATTGATRSGK